MSLLEAFWEAVQGAYPSAYAELYARWEGLSQGANRADGADEATLRAGFALDLSQSFRRDGFRDYEERALHLALHLGSSGKGGLPPERLREAERQLSWCLRHEGKLSQALLAAKRALAHGQDEGPTLSEWELRLEASQMALQLGEKEEAKVLLFGLIPRFSELHNKAFELRTFLLLGELHLRDYAYEEALASLQVARQLAESLGNERSFLEALLLLGETHYELADFSAASQALIQLLPSLDRLDSPLLEGRALALLGFLERLNGDEASSDAVLQRAREKLLESQAEDALARFFLQEGDLKRRLQGPEAALSCYYQALAHAEKTSAYYGSPIAYRIAELNFQTGDLFEADEAIIAAMSEAIEVGDRNGLPRISALSVRIAKGIDSPDLVLDRLLELAELSFEAGKFSDVGHAVRESWEYLLRIADYAVEGFVQVLMAAIHQQKPEELAPNELMDYAAFLMAYAYPEEAAYLAQLEGRMELRQGRLQQALDAFLHAASWLSQRYNERRYEALRGPLLALWDEILSIAERLGIQNVTEWVHERERLASS